MLSTRTGVLLLGSALMLAACGASPAKSIEKDCVRLEMMKDIGGGADAKKSCACLAGKLEESMSKDELKKLAKMLKSAKSADDFDAKAKENQLSDASAMTFMGAAKSCALQ
ncbi:MAG: hypothetical protein AB7P23_04435 [Amphiplicatus sp.]